MFVTSPVFYAAYLFLIFKDFHDPIGIKKISVIPFNDSWNIE